MAKLTVATGTAIAKNGREACVQAIQQAQAKLKKRDDEAVLAILFASPEYNPQDVQNGATAQLRNTPFIGLSTPAQLDEETLNERAVTALIITGDDLHAKTHWVENTGESLTPEGFLDPFRDVADPQALIMIADAFHEESLSLIQALPPQEYAQIGALSGSMRQERYRYQMTATHFGEDGIATALLSGNLKIGIGTGHGWRTVGNYFQITETDGNWIRAIEGKPPIETYVDLFGQESRQWIYPPLNELIRLYPIATKTDEGDYDIHSPSQVAIDGSIRVGKPIASGTYGYIMIGDVQSCVDAIRGAVKQAHKQLRSKPTFGLVFIDLAWKLLLETASVNISALIQDEIGGKRVPLAGGFTLGQIASDKGEAPQVVNQNFKIIFFDQVSTK